jgi:hypothetical protein
MPGSGVLARARACRKFVLPALLLGLATGTPGVAAAANRAADNPIGVHSMLYLTDPFGAKAAMFKEAAAVNASTIRLDIELSAVFAKPNSSPDWTEVDQYLSLARRYHLRVLADLMATPWYMADCPPATPVEVAYRCPPRDPAQWGRQVGELAAHTRGTIDYFEIINEPDGSWAFLGTPSQYAAILQASYDAIHAADPAAKVALGGLMNIGAGGQVWLNEMLSSACTDARQKFDVANIHVRVRAAQTGQIVARWRRYFARRGFRGPLWVTEAGYPADPAWQNDPAYQGGGPAQARYLATAIPNMINAGATKVFITERDTTTGPFASEGFLHTQDPLPAAPVYSRRESFYTIQRLARARWPSARSARRTRLASANGSRRARRSRSAAGRGGTARSRASHTREGATAAAETTLPLR